MRGFFTNVGRSRSNMKKALLIGALALLGALTIAGQAFAATPTSSTASRPTQRDG